MLILELIEISKNFIKYRYVPEGKEESGVIVLDKETGEVKIESLAKDYDSSYMGHAVHRIDEYYTKDSYPQKDMVVWY